MPRKSTFEPYDDLTPTSSFEPYEDQVEEEDSFGSGYGLPSLYDIGLTAIKAPFEAQKGLMGLADLVTTPMRSASEKIGSYFGYDEPIPGIRESVRDLGYDPQNVLNRLEAFDSPELKAARREIGEADGFVDSVNAYWRNPGVLGLEAESSAPSIALGGAYGQGLRMLGMGARFATPLAEGLQTAGEHAAGVFDEKGSFEIEDVPYALTSGAATALIGAGGNQIARKLGLPDIDEMMASGDLRGIRRIQAILGGGAVEGLLEEAPQSGSEQAISNLATGKPWSEGVPGAMISGAATGFGLGSAGPMFGRSRPPMSDNYTQQEFDFGPPDPRQMQLPFDPVQGPQSQPSKIWPGIDPVSGRFRKIYPEATVQGQLPLEPPSDEGGQFDLGLSGNEPIDPNEPPPGGPRAKSYTDVLEKIANETGSIPPPSDWFGQGGNEPLPGETTGRVAGMPASAQDALANILNNLGNDPVVDASASDFQLRVSKSTNPQELTGLLHVIEMHPRQDAITRGLADVVRQRLNTIQPEVRYQAPDPLAAVPNPEGRGNFGNEAWEESLDDMVRTGPIGLVDSPGRTITDQTMRESDKIIDDAGNTEWEEIPYGLPPIDRAKLQGFIENAPWQPPQYAINPEPPPVPIRPDTFSDEQARGIVDRAFPPPGPEPQPATEYGQNAIDEEARQWMLNQDRIIAENQAANGPIMGPNEQVTQLTPRSDDHVNYNKGRGRVQIYNLAEDLINQLNKNIPDDPRIDTIIQQAEQLIMNETDPEIIADNFRQLEEYAQRAHLPEGSPDQIELLGMLRDTALDKLRGGNDEDVPRFQRADDEPPKRPPSIREQLGIPPDVPSIPIADQNDFNNSQVRGESPGRMLASEAIEDVEGRDAAIEELMRQNYGYTPIQAPTSDEDFMNQVMGSGIAYANKPRNTQGQLPFAPGELERYMEAMNPNKPTPTTGEEERPSFQRSDRKYKDQTPERYKRYQVFNENDELIDETYDKDEAHRWADEHDGYVNDKGEQKLDDEPRFARAKGGGLVMSAHITRMATNLTKDYTGELSGIMVREAGQNGLDAVKDMGVDGKVVIRLNYGDINHNNAATMEVYDNGKGMDEQTLTNKLAELFASGKEDEEGASGGKGIGSASYMLGGEHFIIETVADDLNDVYDQDDNLVRKADGKRYRITAGGTPAQFLDKKKGSDWEQVEVDKSTPTGTRVKTVLKSDQHIVYSKHMAKNIGSFSRDKETTIIFDPNDFSNGKDITTIDENTSNYIEKLTIPSTNDDKVIGEFNYNNSDIAISIPPFNETKENSEINVHYLNNGMYQFSEYRSVEKARGIPPDVIVNIKPQMDEQEDDYPFINTREDVKKDMREHIKDFVDKHITSPAINKKKNRTQELYDMMPVVPIPGTKRKVTIFDPGGRLKPQELQSVLRSPQIHALVRHYDKLIDDILTATGRTEWANRLEGIGIVFDQDTSGSLNGVHIPNPSTGKSTILINPFARMEMGVSPADNAFANTITNLHEAAHIGKEAGFLTDPVPPNVDVSDPRYLKFYQSFYEQMHQHGDVGWSSTGHGMDFLHRLGEVYAKFGPARTFEAADRIEAIFTGTTRKNIKDYHPEFQRLLQVYIDSRGRPETTEDLLSRTGVKQSDPRRGGKSVLPGNVGQPGAGAVTEATIGKVLVDETVRLIKDETGAMPIPSWKDIKGKTGWGQGKSKPVGYGPQYNALHEAIMLPAGANTTGDLSAPGRQGLALIHTPQYWKALWRMPQGLWNNRFEAIDKELRSKAIFQPRWNPMTKKYEPSLAQRAGLELMVPASSIAPGPRAQQIASKWLETGGFLGPEYIGKVKNPIRAGYFHTIGYPVRASNRAFITFLNTLRANRFEYLVNRAQDMADIGAKTGKIPMAGIMGGPRIAGHYLGLRQSISKKDAAAMDPWLNDDVAKEIADFVNTATGAGPLKTHILPFRQAELNLEKHATLLSGIFFSPGLMASRIRMLNPNTYVMATPHMRKEYMKSALATAGAWYAISHLLKMAAEGMGLDDVEISDKITSADFGKVRIGETRLDVGGGFQQFLVNYARGWYGGWTSSATGEFHKFGEGFRAETQRGNIERFLTNKMNPVVKFAYDIADADQYAPFHVYDRMAQLAVPLYIQDIMELANENPELYPLGAAVAMFGGGTQMYGKGESVGKMIAPENDWLATGGGGIRSLMPWNIGKEEWEVTDFPFQNPEDSFEEY